MNKHKVNMQLLLEKFDDKVKMGANDAVNY